MTETDSRGARAERRAQGVAASPSTRAPRQRQPPPPTHRTGYSCPVDSDSPPPLVGGPVKQEASVSSHHLSRGSAPPHRAFSQSPASLAEPDQEPFPSPVPARRKQTPSRNQQSPESLFWEEDDEGEHTFDGPYTQHENDDNVDDFDDFYASDDENPNGFQPTPTQPTPQKPDPLAKIDDSGDKGTDDDDEEDPPADLTPSRTPKGPISQKIKDDMEACFLRIDTIFFELEKKTGRSVENLVGHYRARFSHSQSARNFWNVYQTRFSQDQENQKRLAGSDSSSCKEAYQAFMARHPDNYQSLLETFEEASEIEKLLGTTVGQRKAEFKKFSTLLSSMCDRFYKRQGFDIAVIGVGNIVNADGGLQFHYETPGVEGFLEALPIGYNTLIAMLRTRAFTSEVQKNVELFKGLISEKHPHLLTTLDVGSLVNQDVDLTQITQLLNLIGRNWPHLLPSASTASSTLPSTSTTTTTTTTITTNAASAAHAPSPALSSGAYASGVHNPSGETVSTPSAHSSVVGDDDEDEDAPEKVFKKFVLGSVEALGFPFPRGNFPWKALESKIAPHNLIIVNYPEQCLFPTSNDTTLLPKYVKKARSASRTGICGALSTKALETLAEACSPTHPNPLCIKKGPGKARLRDGIAPWIIGVQPSDPGLGRRELYVGGLCRRQTVTQPPPTPPPHRKTPPSPPYHSKDAPSPPQSASAKRTHQGELETLPGVKVKRTRGLGQSRAPSLVPTTRDPAPPSSQNPTPTDLTLKGPKAPEVPKVDVGRKHQPPADLKPPPPRPRPEPRRRPPGHKAGPGPERLKDPSCTPNPPMRDRCPSVDPFDIGPSRQIRPRRSDAMDVDYMGAELLTVVDGNFSQKFNSGFAPPSNIDTQIAPTFPPISISSPPPPAIRQTSAHPEYESVFAQSESGFNAASNPTAPPVTQPYLSTSHTFPTPDFATPQSPSAGFPPTFNPFQMASSQLSSNPVLPAAPPSFRQHQPPAVTHPQQQQSSGFVNHPQGVQWGAQQTRQQNEQAHLDAQQRLDEMKRFMAQFEMQLQQQFPGSGGAGGQPPS